MSQPACEQTNFDLEADAETLHDAGGIVLHDGLGGLGSVLRIMSFARWAWYGAR